MKNKLRIGLIATVTIVLLFVLGGCDKKAAVSAAPPSSPPKVSVVVIEPQRVSLTNEFPGRTSPYMIAEVRPQVGGIIQKRLFTEGSDVKAGDVLYQIDPATYQAADNSARALLARAEANLIPAKLKEERFRELVQIKAVSQQDYDDVNAAFKQAEADVSVAKAAMETAHINLAYTRITAPISGRIGRSTVTTGALVTASQADPLATIQQLDPVYVDVTQTITDLLQMKRNIASGLMENSAPEQAEVKLLLEDGTPYPALGTMKFSDVTVNQSTGSVTLRTVFPNPDQLLLPGMFVRAIVEEGMNEQALLVPQRGVTRNPAGQAMVMVVGAEDKVEARIIGVVRTVGDNWLVSEGLQAGDRVILEGIQRARPGSPVSPVLFGGPSEPVAAAPAPQPAVAKK
jgi:membrane fusion protein (multidrug efflux system)